MWFGSSVSATKWRRLGRMRLICCSSMVLMMSRPSGGMGTFIRAQIHGFEERGYAVRVFHGGNSGRASFLRLANQASRPLNEAFLGWVIGKAAQRAMHEGVAAVISHGLVGWYPLRVPP